MARKLIASISFVGDGFYERITEDGKVHIKYERLTEEEKLLMASLHSLVGCSSEGYEIQVYEK